MFKRNWHFLLLAFLLADLGYSFWQYYHLPLDGDMAVITWPSESYTPVLSDPFGLRALLHHETYAAPNRFFAHFFMAEYFRHVPLFLQRWLLPIDSVYAACALLKLAVHLLLVYVMAVAISNSRNVLGKPFLLVAALVTPLFQTSGFNGQMGVIDISITYSIFYALPVSLLLLFFLPFARETLYGQPARLSPVGYVAMLGLMVWLSLNGPVVPATVVLVCPAALLVEWYQRFRQQPLSGAVLSRAGQALAALSWQRDSLFVIFSLFSLYSLYIGRYNIENSWTNISLMQRYELLPRGVFNQLSGKLGLPLLLLALLMNIWLLTKYPTTPFGRKALKALQWLGIFALVYILLLPLGGYRSYREDIVRRDSILPIIIGMLGCFAASAYYLLTQLPMPARQRYAAAITVVLAIFTIADKPRPRDFNTCERRLLTLVAQSPDPIVRLPADCTIMDWQTIPDYHKTELDGQMLHYWHITKTSKLYYQQ